MWLTLLFQTDPIKNLISLEKIGRLHARVKHHQNALLKKVADQYQCFWIDLNRSDIVF